MNGGNNFKHREAYNILAREPRWASLKDNGLNHTGNLPKNVASKTLHNSSPGNSTGSNNLSEDPGAPPILQSAPPNYELDGSLYEDFHVLQHKELKNQWDYLKRQWKIWRGLINRIGHGYDSVSGTFDWPEEVWTNIIAVNSEAKKYKIAPLQHKDLLEKLFDGLSATGDFAWSSGMASVPSSTQQSEYVPLPDDMNVDDTQVPLTGVDYPWDGEAIPSYDAPISPVREPTHGSTSRSRTPAP
ncbi:hypothetical protein GIB67_018586 [Kingdonia uniflora]|uniref:Myb/SANT-like domain-containing protein n=1 Tax=Kingdonia uniflora TaxID=39325 RepID=A0A7J7L873_9MAGN|nr:hypothetical protein GIB67_018586 [Kingdonia uniflora]